MDTEITAAELSQLRDGDYAVIDIRDATAFDYGHIGGSVSIPLPELASAELPEGKKLVLYCKSGVISIDAAEELRESQFPLVTVHRISADFFKAFLYFV